MVQGKGGLALGRDGPRKSIHPPTGRTDLDDDAEADAEAQGGVDGRGEDRAVLLHLFVGGGEGAGWGVVRYGRGLTD